MKKALLGVGVCLLLLVIVVAAVFVPIFSGNQPPVDGAQLGSAGATQVLDGYVSAFLLPAGEGEVALVDCGNDPSGAAILAALKAKGLGPEAVKAIFLTHGHPDHVSACHLFTHAEVYAFAGDVKIAAGEERAKGPLPKLFDLPKEKAAKVTKTLNDGETITLGTLTMKVYSVPGHTAGSAAFLANSVLYLGDSANGKADGKSIKSAPGIFSDDTAQNVASLKKLHERLKAENAEVKTLAFSHSGPVEGLDALLGAGQ
jgi:glyoxylase-like metal-dependent hydrolase (beta-lactamase superfamily II)